MHIVSGNGLDFCARNSQTHAMSALKILAGVVSIAALPTLVFIFRWFLLNTDVLVAYNWSWVGSNFYPNFDIRNLSRSKSYSLGNIKYTRAKGKEVLTIDNTSIWGHELKPGSIHHVSTAPLLKFGSLQDCLSVEVRVRLQSGREIKGQGPGQLYTGFRKFAFAIRQRIEKISLPLPS